MSARRWIAGAAAMAAAMVMAAAPAPVLAQGTSRPPPQDRGAGGRFELSGGVGWMGGWDLGTGTATLTGNGVPTGAPVTLFEAETRVESGPRFDARLGWHLTRTVAVEAGLGVTRTHLRSDIRDDFEQAPPLTLRESFTEYAFEGGVVLQVAKLAFAGGRARPFVTGGAGYLRQVHEGSTRIDTGQIGYAGGGVTLVVRQARRRAFLDTLGVRGDARFNVRSGGFETETDGESGVRFGPSVGVGLFVRF